MALTKVTGSVIKDSVSLSGNVSVGGTLTYQDVTNVDALGIGTFRTGIKVLAGQVDVGSNIKLGNAGVITATSFSGVMSGTTGSFSGQVNVGSNIKLGTAGVVTATSFSGSGANLTSLPAANLTGTLPAISGANLTNLPDSDSITEGNSYAEILDTGTNGIFRFVPEGSEVFRITHDGKMGLNETNPTRDVVFKNAGGNCQVSITAGTSNSAYLNLGDTDDDNIGSIYYDNSNNRIVFRANTTDIVRMESDGNIRILDGNLRIATAGHGIDFSAQTPTSATGASTTAEILDHYEEGSWTPVYGNVNTPTYGHRSGTYTRIGRAVHCQFQISVDSGLDTSDGSAVNIGGLPFAGNSAHESVVFSFGRYTSIMSNARLAEVTNFRFGGTYIMLHRGSNYDTNYTLLNSSGHLQAAFTYQMA